MSYNFNPPFHRLNTSTGWQVFAQDPDTETVYGNYRFKWKIAAPTAAVGAFQRICLSIDNGQTWMEENSVWALHSANYNRIGNYYDLTTDLNQTLLAARDEWIVARRRKLDKKRREELNALPREQRALIKAERSAAWKLRKQKGEERRMERTAKIMSQVLQIGPDLVRLKEDIEGLLVVMAKGGMDRPFAFYHSRRRIITHTKWAIKNMRDAIEAAQKRTAGKR